MDNILQIERVELFDPKVNIIFKTSVESNTDNLKQKVITALKNCFERNEVTRANIVFDKDKAFYHINPHSSCRIIEVNSEEEVELNYHKPLDIFRGELMDVYLIDNGHKINLSFICHHLFGDGNAVIIFIEQIMNELNGKIVGEHNLKLVSLEDILKKEKLNFVFRRYIHKENRKTKQIYPYQKKDYFMAYDISNKTKYYSDVYSISLIQLEKLYKDAKRIGVTLNSYFFAALLESNPDITSLGLATSIRENESLSNQVSGNAIKYKYKVNKSFEYNALKIHQKIKKITQKHPYFALELMSSLNYSLIDSIVLNQYGLGHYSKVKTIEKLYGFDDKTKREVGITNLTKVRIERNYGEFLVGEIYFIPPITSYTKMTIGIITDSYGCHFSIHSVDDKTRINIFKNFIDRLLSKSK